MSLRQNAFIWAPATPTRSRQSGLCVMGRVGCIGSGGDQWSWSADFHKTVNGGKRGTVGAPRVSGASEGRERQEVVCSNCGATAHGSISENFR